MSLKYRLEVPSGKPDDAELPLVIVLHGRGADANDLADIAPYLDDGYRFVFPNAPKPFEPYPGMAMGYTWFDGWPAERSSIVASRNELLSFIDDVVSKYPTPPGKIVLSGFSQGGLMSIDVGFRTRQQLAGLVVMSGAVYEEDLPPFRRDLPVLLVHGAMDDVIPVLVAHRARRVLESAGVDVDYDEYPMGHEVSPESLARVGEFIHSKFMSGRPSIGE
jgi:phospholipase/carboxylesterase